MKSIYPADFFLYISNMKSKILINQEAPIYLGRRQELLDHAEGKDVRKNGRLDRQFQLKRYESLKTKEPEFFELAGRMRMDVIETLTCYDLLSRNNFLAVYMAAGNQFVNPEEVFRGLDMKETFKAHFQDQLTPEIAEEMWYTLGNVTIKNGVGTTKGGAELRNVLCIRGARFITAHDTLRGDFAVTLNGTEVGIEHKGDMCRLCGQKVPWDIQAFNVAGRGWRERLDLPYRSGPFKNQRDWMDLNRKLMETGQFQPVWTELLWALFPTRSEEWCANQAGCMERIIMDTPEWVHIGRKVARRTGRNYAKGDTIDYYKETNPLNRYGKMVMEYLGAIQAHLYQKEEGFDYIWFELDGKYYPMDWKNKSPEAIYEMIFGKLLVSGGFNGTSREKSIQFSINPPDKSNIFNYQMELCVE